MTQRAKIQKNNCKNKKNGGGDTRPVLIKYDKICASLRKMAEEK